MNENDVKSTCNEQCKETEEPCSFLIIDDDGLPSCSAEDETTCQKFIEFKKKMDEARATGKKITVQVTKKGLKYLKSNLMYWIMKPKYEMAIREFYAMSEEERQAWLEKAMASENLKVE